MVEVPIQVADHVKNVWTGTLNYSAPSEDIRDLEGLHLEYMDNTVIETYDGDFLACGREVERKDGREKWNLNIRYMNFLHK